MEQGAALPRLNKIPFFATNGVLVLAAIIIRLTSSNPGFGEWFLVVLCLIIGCGATCFALWTDFGLQIKGASVTLAPQPALTAEQLARLESALVELQKLEALQSPFAERMERLDNAGKAVVASAKRFSELYAQASSKKEASPASPCSAGETLTSLNQSLDAQFQQHYQWSHERFVSISNQLETLSGAIAVVQAQIVQLPGQVIMAMPVPPAKRKKGRTAAQSESESEDEEFTPSAALPSPSRETAPARTATETVPVITQLEAVHRAEEVLSVAEVLPEPAALSEEPSPVVLETLQGSDADEPVRDAPQQPLPEAPNVGLPDLPPASDGLPDTPEQRLMQTTLVAQVLIGIGNKPYVRGVGPGLSMEKGVAMEFMEIGKWRWMAPDGVSRIQVQILKNDEFPSSEGMIDLLPGSSTVVMPHFLR